MRKRLLLPLMSLLILSACAILPHSSPVEVIPTITPMIIVITPTLPPTVTATPLPPTHTPTLPPTETPMAVSSPTPTSTATQPPEPLPFHPQLGTGRYIAAFPHADLGCQWVGIGGQVLDEQGNGISNITVMVTGQVDGKPVDQVSGTGSESSYGPGGYEMRLADHLPTVGQDLLIQLFHEDGRPLSDPRAFDLPSTCEENLALYNFQTSNVLIPAYLPVISSIP